MFATNNKYMFIERRTKGWVRVQTNVLNEMLKDINVSVICSNDTLGNEHFIFSDDKKEYHIDIISTVIGVKKLLSKL